MAAMNANWKMNMKRKWRKIKICIFFFWCLCVYVYKLLCANMPTNGTAGNGIVRIQTECFAGAE